MLWICDQSLPAARGAAAEVPVCVCVHLPLKSVVEICLSLFPVGSPLLYVTANVPGHASEYHGFRPQLSTAPMEMVKGELM